MDEKEFQQGLRHLALSLVDHLERKLDITPRTAEIRRWYKQQARQKNEASELEVATESSWPLYSLESKIKYHAPLSQY